ncbi:class-II aminoacyl-tRNA synthetase family protein [Rhodohalobacter halophilus]|uniref:hypothetical protein n=1 Tax=Rhodohalobacter halophilus TaxID=1812810 RepID=UPI00083FBBED|nr:hypothetical protein [Rhodohalobacter halophilus]
MKWTKWKSRRTIPQIKQPGVYYIALSDQDISGQPFRFIEEIIYVGVSISKKGVLGRLYQFKKAMEGINGVHGGAERVRFKHTEVRDFFSRVYICVNSFPLTENDHVFNWKQKGECLKEEYVSIAMYLDHFGRLPEFNDQKRSKKK